MMKNLLFFLFFPALLFSKTIYVKKDATGQNNGTSWQHAFKEVHAGLGAAEYGDEIWVSSGTYSPYVPDVSVSFVLKNGVKLLGGFAGNESSAASRNWLSNETILSGIGPYPYGLYNVVYAEGTDSTTVIDGFTIRDGSALAYNGAPCDSVPNLHICFGAGLYMYNDLTGPATRLNIFNCRFVNNQADYGGGFAANFAQGSGGFVMKNCYFKNTAYSGGGMGIYIGGAVQYPMVVDSCIFEDNWANIFGALVIQSAQTKSPVIVTNCLFRNNIGSMAGGAVSVNSVIAEIPTRFDNCDFIGNQASVWFGGKGGAISGASVDINSCSFINNKALCGGALNGLHFRVFNSLFWNNTAKVRGGAIQCGVFNIISNCNFISNKSQKDGGGVCFTGDSQDSIVNCIFWGNEATEQGAQVHSLFRDTIFLDHNYFSSADCAALLADLNGPDVVFTCTNNIFLPVEPEFVSDFYLSACSPLLNRGDSSWVQRFGLAYDYAGNTRIQDGLPDLGALETPQFRLSPEALPVSCFGGSDGAILPNPVGGQPPFTFWWNNTSADLNQVPAGEGLLIGLDANGCADTVSLTVPQPEALSGQLYSQAATTLQMPDGQAGLQQASGGQLPYQYLWSNGNTTPQINELSPGWYQLSITDAAGCVWSDSVLVDYSVGVRPLTPNHWHIGPNPATDWLRIWPSEGVAPSGWTLRLLDARGVPVAPTQRLPETGALVPMRHLPAGVYWLQLEKAGEYPQVFTIKK